MRATWIAASFVIVAAAACSNSDGGGQQTGDDVQTVDAPKPVCGDGICSSSEINTCDSDCGGGQQPVCGNGICEAGETCTADCNPLPPDGPVVTPMDAPGGALNCNDTATIFACFLCISDPTQCTGIYTATACNACFGGLSLCDGGAADGICEADEDNSICPEDCP